MTRSAWLVLSVAVLFGAQGPLCASACLEQAAAANSAFANSPPSPEPAPCHESAPVPAGSSTPPSGEHECSCDRLQLVVPNADGGKPAPSAAPLLTPGTFASLRPALFPSRASRIRDRFRSLPPPDILRLNSTLLL